MTYQIIVTSQAQQRIAYLTENYPGSFLRLRVESGGCKGLQYIFVLDKQTMPDDIFLDSNEKFIIDELSLSFLQGAQVDYIQDDLMGESFVVTNPQASSTCGCGSSFTPHE